MSKHPLKQKQVNVDSLANAAYEKWYAKNVKPKQDALSDREVRDKYDATIHFGECRVPHHVPHASASAKENN